LTHALGASGIREIFSMESPPPAPALTIEFLTPMARDEVIEIRVSNTELGTSSFGFQVQGRNAAAEITFRATLTQVTISAHSKHPVPRPQALREALSAA
jgi:acyl-CoA thioesterase FadM